MVLSVTPLGFLDTSLKYFLNICSSGRQENYWAIMSPMLNALTKYINTYGKNSVIPRNYSCFDVSTLLVMYITIVGTIP